MPVYCVKHTIMAITGYTTSSDYVETKSKPIDFEYYTSTNKWVDTKPRGFVHIENQIRGFENVDKNEVVQIEGIRSAGITTALLNYMLYLFQHTNNTIIYFTNTSVAAQEAAVKFKTLLNALKEDPSTKADSKSHIRSKTGADVFFKSIYDRKSLRGMNCNNLIIDNVEARSRDGAKFYSDNNILKSSSDYYDLTLEINLPTHLTDQLVLCTSGYFNGIMCKPTEDEYQYLHLQVERKVDEYIFKYIDRTPKTETIELNLNASQYQKIQSKASAYGISEEEYIKMVLGFPSRFDLGRA